MKKLVLLLLFLPMILLSQVSIDIKSEYVNLREKADYKSKVLKKLYNNENLGYTGEWNSPWIQVVKPMGYKEKSIVGWVHKDYVQASNFKSRFLSKVDDILEEGDEGAGCYVSGVDGLIIANKIINLNGRRTILNQKDEENYIVYYNNKILIKLFTLSSLDQENGTYKSLAIINYNGKEEIIFVELMCGC